MKYENRLSIIKSHLQKAIAESPSSDFVKSLSDALKIVETTLWYVKIRKKDKWEGYS